MKRRVKLTESDLHRIIKESVNAILTEMDWKYKQWAADERARRNDDVMHNGKNSPYFSKYQKQGLAKGSNYGDFAMLQGKARQQQRNNQQGAKDQFNKDYGYKDSYMNFNNGDYISTDIGLNSDGTGVKGTHSYRNFNDGGNLNLYRSSNVGKDGKGLTRMDFASYQLGYNQPEYQGSSMVHIRPNSFSNINDGEKVINDTGKEMFDKYYREQFNKARDEAFAYRKGRYNYQKGVGFNKR